METIEATGIRYQAWSLFLEDLPDRFGSKLRMVMNLGISDALVQQPSVQLIKTFVSQPDAGVQATGSTRK